MLKKKQRTWSIVIKIRVMLCFIEEIRVMLFSENYELSVFLEFYLLTTIFFTFFFMSGIYFYNRPL
jgi:hypothetical protein